MSRAVLAGVHHTDVCIIGAGLAGCAAALELVRRGRRVTLVEARAVGAGAAVDLGHLAVGLDLAYPAAVERLGHEAARTVWELRRENVARARERMDELGLASQLDPRGGFTVALDRDHARALADGEDLLRDDGFSGEFLDHYMLEARFAVRGLAGGYWAADDAAVDVPSLVHALAAAAESAGAAIFEGSSVRRVDVSPSGVHLGLEGAAVEAEAVVVTGAAATLVSDLAPKVELVSVRRAALPVDATLEVPSPALIDHGRCAWRLRHGRLELRGAGEQADPGLFAQQHVSGLRAGDPSPGPGERTVVSRDVLPFLGPAGTAGVAALAASGGYTFVAVQWIADHLTRGVDRTAAMVHARRPFAG